MVIYFAVTMLAWVLLMPIMILLCDMKLIPIMITMALPVIGYLLFGTYIMLVMTALTEAMLIMVWVRYIHTSKKRS